MFFQELAQDGEDGNRSIITRICWVTRFRDWHNSGKFLIKLGHFPVIKDLLNRLVRLSAITGAVALSIFTEILSAPVDLLELSEEIKIWTLSTEHKNSSGNEDWSKEEKEKESTTLESASKTVEVWLKLLKKRLFRISAFAFSEKTR